MSRKQNDSIFEYIIAIGLFGGILYLLYQLFITIFLFIEKSIIDNFYYIKIYVLTDIIVTFLIYDYRVYKIYKGDLEVYYNGILDRIKSEIKIFINTFFYLISLELYFTVGLLLLIIILCLIAFLFFIITFLMSAISGRYNIIDNFTVKTFLEFCNRVESFLF